jgi:hypothetical protein
VLLDLNVSRSKLFVSRPVTPEQYAVVHPRTTPGTPHPPPSIVLPGCIGMVSFNHIYPFRALHMSGTSAWLLPQDTLLRLQASGACLTATHYAPAGMQHTLPQAGPSGRCAALTPLRRCAPLPRRAAMCMSPPYAVTPVAGAREAAAQRAAVAVLRLFNRHHEMKQTLDESCSGQPSARFQMSTGPRNGDRSAIME